MLNFNPARWVDSMRRCGVNVTVFQGQICFWEERGAHRDPDKQLSLMAVYQSAVNGRDALMAHMTRVAA